VTPQLAARRSISFRIKLTGSPAQCQAAHADLGVPHGNPARRQERAPS
jgi:hypothetical protein